MLVGMEATDHYGRNLHCALCEHGYRVAVVNPVRTHRFALEDLERAKTDAINALGIGRFVAQKKPIPTLPSFRWTKPRSSSASWCGSSNGSPRTVVIAHARSTGSSTSASPSSRDTWPTYALSGPPLS
jgi:Transposase